MATIRKRGDRWQVQVRRQGYAPAARSFIRKSDAETWARQREAEVDGGIERVDLAQLRLTRLKDLLARYELEVTPTKKSQQVETY